MSFYMVVLHIYPQSSYLFSFNLSLMSLFTTNDVSMRFHGHNEEVYSIVP